MLHHITMEQSPETKAFVLRKETESALNGHIEAMKELSEAITTAVDNAVKASEKLSALVKDTLEHLNAIQ